MSHLNLRLVVQKQDFLQLKTLVTIIPNIYLYLTILQCLIALV